MHNIREFQNGRQLGKTVKIDAENINAAKKQNLLRASIFSDEQHIENEVGVVLIIRINGCWKDPSYTPKPPSDRKTVGIESSYPVFIVNEMCGKRQLHSTSIQAKNLRGAKNKAYRIASTWDCTITINTPEGVLLAKREKGSWQLLDWSHEGS